MGSYDRAELCELVGLFILHSLKDTYGPNTSGLYRDDGLCCFNNISGPESDRIRKDRIKLFEEKFNLRITPILSWEIIDRARPYRNGRKTCSLCFTEKFHIITSKRQLLNKRSELVSTCRHATKFSLKSYKVFPPDHT